MKKSLLTTILLAASSFSALAQTTEHWVQGVTRTDGWVDQDKDKNEIYNEYKCIENGNTYTWVATPDASGSSLYFKNGADGDGFLCWAASATDILTWWHSQNPSVAQENPAVPHEQGEIWELFKENYANDSGSADAGIKWYMQGITTEHEPTPRNKDTMNPAGYYPGMLVDSLYYDIRQFDPCYIETDTDIIYNPEAYEGPQVDVHLKIAQTMSNLIDQGYIISLGIGSETGSKHAVTLWGLKTDSDGYLTKMWITDSDDSLLGYGTDLIELDCERMENIMMLTEEVVYGREKAYGITSTGKTYQEKEFSEKEGRLWYEYNEDTGRNDYFYDFSAFKFSTVDYQGVPEPASGTLSLVALAGLCARRRRK